MESKSPFCTLSDAELTEKAKELIQELIDSGGKSWTLHVPARPNSDPDLIFTELNRRFVQKVHTEFKYGSLQHDHQELKDQLARVEQNDLEAITVADYEEVLADHRRLVRELDMIINGDNAAKQASLCDVVSQLRNEWPKGQTGVRWVKASERLPLSKAFWNIEDGFKKDCSFPVRIDDNQYGMADLYDNRKEGAPDPIYYFVVKGDFGKEYYKDEFHRFEWLDEAPESLNPELLRVIRDAEKSKEEDLKAVKEVITKEKLGKLTQSRADFIREANNRDLDGAGREDAVEQGAIAFADWGNKNVKGFDPIEEKWVYGEDEKRYTTAQLYTIFKQQKEK